MTSLREDLSPAVSIAGAPPASGEPTSIDEAIAYAIDQRASYRELLEALGVAVYTTDAQGVITDYNEAAVELWGRRPEVGKDEWCGSWRLYWPDGSPMAHSDCPMGVTLRENRPVRGAEAIGERPDGSRFWFVPYPTPLRDPAGRLIGAVNVMVDITGRKNAELALEESHALLTDALAIKDEFLSLVSHELKTPITMILGNAQVLMRGDQAITYDDRQTALTDIARESERLHAIIDNLLVLARAESGQQVEYEPLPVGHLVADAVGEFQREHPSRAIRVSRRDHNALVDGDTTQIRQVMNNLLSNAVKYSPPKTAIDVETETAGDSVRIRVLDRGRGIPDGENDKVFDTFYRSPATAGAVSGVGVGLAVCKRLIEAMGGAVWARNRDGGGADVGFSLPLLTFDDE